MYYRVRIHMFNLYQNQIITKEIIEAKQLDLCRLAFWLCICENECYIPISSASYSCIIRESRFHKFYNSFFHCHFFCIGKIINRSGLSQRMNNQMTSAIPYLMKQIEYFNQDNTNSDKLSFFIPTINSS